MRSLFSLLMAGIFSLVVVACSSSSDDDSNQLNNALLGLLLMQSMQSELEPHDYTYITIDVSAGHEAEYYPVSKSDSAPEGLNEGFFYKTDRIVLRRIPAGTFYMGSPSDELGRMDDREDLHQVTLTQDFYIGVFPVTQRQWQQVMGARPSDHEGDTRPVEMVSWEDVRGGTWDGPDGGSPDPDSFIGVLAAKTGLPLDLPTETQWEYACRAGTQTALNNGKNLTAEDDFCPHLDEVARYIDNGGQDEQHAPVGSYDPNAWGLYDMHGNIFEWCLDWFDERLGTVAVTDPVGPDSGFNRVMRGGSWNTSAFGCRAATRGSMSPSNSTDEFGFRLAASAQPIAPQGDG